MKLLSQLSSVIERRSGFTYLISAQLKGKGSLVTSSSILVSRITAHFILFKAWVNIGCLVS